MSKSLVKMECPFTWEIDEQLSKNFEEKEEPIIEADEEPLLALINSMMITYFRAVQGDYKGALENLEATETIWKIFNETAANNDGGSTMVLKHIVHATGYHVMSLTKNTLQAQSLLKNLNSASDFQSPVQVATVNGCKAVAWTCFHEKGHVEALSFARIAAANDPECPLWQYILSKSARHARKNENILSPSAIERDAIVKCCQLTDSPFYKIHLAQMYRECKMYQECNKIYLEIFNTNPKNPGILLRLARGFTTSKKFDEAKKCFEEAEKYPKISMFWHYKGIFYEKQRNLLDAAECFKTAAKSENYGADLQYSIVMSKLLRNKFDFVGHLVEMLDKYDNYPVYKLQTFLHIGMQFVFRKSNLKDALPYFLNAIEINPQSGLLQNFSNCTIDWKRCDIYKFISGKLGQLNGSDEELGETRNVVQKLRDLCEEHMKSQVLDSFDKMKI